MFWAKGPWFWFQCMGRNRSSVKSSGQEFRGCEEIIDVTMTDYVGIMVQKYPFS